MNSCVYLQHVDKIDITAGVHFLHEFNELLLKPFVGFDPGCVEVKSQGSPEHQQR